VNLVDRILKSTINRVFTTDEWHTLVVGFADGLSFDMEGGYMRKALTKPGIDVENVDKEKIWYWKVPYVAGEMTKVAVAYFVLN
jgi:hypothetical protein